MSSTENYTQIWTAPHLARGLIKKGRPVSAKREREWRGRHLKRYMGSLEKRTARWGKLVQTYGIESALYASRGRMWIPHKEYSKQ